MPPFAEPHKIRLRITVWSVILLLLFIISAEILLRSRAQRPVPPSPEGRLTVQYPIMGTVAAVTLHGGTAQDREDAVKMISQTFRKIETLGSLYRPGSELSRLNALAYAAPFACSEPMWQILSAARRAHSTSGGAFDVSAKPLMDLWGFYRKNAPAQQPSEQERKAAMAKVGLDKVVFDETAHTVRFTVPGMALDLGGVAKGYAVDLALRQIDRKKISGGIINLGGNLRVFGSRNGKDTCHIGLKDPADRKRVAAILLLREESTATSGDYERFVTIGGKRFCHIVDPATGAPVEGIHAVTVITPNALDADVFSTSVFLRGEALARKLAATVPGTSFLLYSGKGEPVPIAIPRGKVRLVRTPRANSK